MKIFKALCTWVSDFLTEYGRQTLESQGVSPDEE